MILDNILGFWATDDPEVFASWIAKARVRYTELEQALEPLQKVVRELEPNWQPRHPAYWQRTMEHLLLLRQATQACRLLFAREQSSQECPVPLAMIGHHLSYHISLSFTRKYEEVGIVLTGPCAAPYSLEVAHIRQRQEVFKALRALCDAVQKAIREGRTGLDALLAEYQTAQALSQPPRVRCRAGRRQARSRARRPALRLVGGKALEPRQQEGEPGQ